MKSIIFLSHLSDEHERGGAYLRNSALLSCFESWGLKVASFYRSEFKLRNQYLKKFIMGLRFGKEIRSLFTKSSFNVPECDALIIDTFKYFSWDFNYTGKKPIIIYNAHNLEFENHFGKESSTKKDNFALYESKRLEEVDYIFVCSKREQDILNSLNKNLMSKIFVFPNLVSQSKFERSSEQVRKYISFIGTLDYYPNVEAIKYLAQRFFPRVSDDVKKVLVIAGRRPAEQVCEICREFNIELRTDLSEEEMIQLYLETDILLVPLEHGSGTRLKIIEGVLAGCRILSTSIGREGIEGDAIVETKLDDFFDNFEILYKSKGSNVEVEQTFLENYELQTWTEHNKESLLNFLKPKTSL